jgi:hypothetical protein
MHHPSRKFAFKQSKFYENYAKNTIFNHFFNFRKTSFEEEEKRLPLKKKKKTSFEEEEKDFL